MRPTLSSAQPATADVVACIGQHGYEEGRPAHNEQISGGVLAGQRITQAMLQLAANAAQYSPSGSVLLQIFEL